MSSLAAARADNFYYPPEWTPQMGGISKFQGSKGKNQYEQHGIIRFELPFDAWCLGCGTHMTKGLRFNAKKEKEGKYFTTQIWAFTMKCFSCEQRFKILTDPKNATYDMAEGIRKHEQDFTPEQDDSLIVATSDETRQLIASDPMFRLQHNEEDKQRVLTAKERMDALIEVQDAHHKDYYDANSILRNRNRKRKKRDIELKNEGAALGLSMPLVEPTQEDAEAAKAVVFKKKAFPNSFGVTEKHRLTNIQAQSIFDRPATTTTTASASSRSVKQRTSQHRPSSETRLVVLSSSITSASHHQPRATELDSRGKFSDTARLLTKANARQIDPRALKITGPTAVSSVASSTVSVLGGGVLGFGEPGKQRGSQATSAAGGAAPVKVVAVARPKTAPVTSADTNNASGSASASCDGMSSSAGQGAAKSSVLDLLAGY